MISLLLLVLTMTLSAIIVRMGTIALELTGLPEEKAYFQSLSAYAGVGFTTREAELVLTHPERRKIIRVLIQFGSAGVITTIGTLAGTLISGESILHSMMEPSYREWLPVTPAQLLLALTILFAGTVYIGLRRPGPRRLLDEIMAVWLIHRNFVTPTSVEEVLVNSDGCGVLRIEVSNTSPLCGRSLPPNEPFTLLAVERTNEALTLPPKSTVFQNGDRLTIFGPVSTLGKMCTPRVVGDLSEEHDRSDDALLAIGSEAPRFNLTDQHGVTFSLDESIRRGTTILVFYPKDRSYHCSGVLRSFSEYLPELEKDGIAVVAINPASTESHKRFCDLLSSPLPLLSDRKRRVCRSYRALMLFGLVVNRCIYVVGPDGRIAYGKRGRPPIIEVIAAARVAQGSHVTKSD